MTKTSVEHSPGPRPVQPFASERSRAFELPAVSPLEALLAPELVRALEELVDQRVRHKLDTQPTEAIVSSRRWLTVAEAAAALACSPDAIRMRIARGRLQHRRHGRRIYVSAASIDELR